MTDLTHKFEIKGLGEAPFELDSYIKAPDTTCDFCGKTLVHVFVIRSSDNKRFNVGSTCVLNTKDSQLRQAIIEKKAALKAQTEHDRIERVEKLLSRDDVLIALDQQTSPSPWAQQGKTAKDWCMWMMKNSEKTGKLKVANYLEKFEFD